MTKLKPMLLNFRIYGRYNPDTGMFWCTHGAWECKIEFIDDEKCTLFKETVDYQFIDVIPEDYDRV